MFNRHLSAQWADRWQNPSIMKKTLFFASLALTAFACSPDANNEDVLPIERSTTGGDDEDPIIQGDTTLVSLIDANTLEILDYTLTDNRGGFELKLPEGKPLILRVICPDGHFRDSEAFDYESVPRIVTI